MAEIRIVDALRAEIKNIDSKVNLITQELHNIKKNEEILGRTIVTLNEKLSRVEANGGGGGMSSSAAAAGEAVDATQNQRLDELNEKISELAKAQEELKTTLDQVKYSLDMINPLEFVTVRQVNELVEEKVDELTKQAASGAKKKKD